MHPWLARFIVIFAGAAGVLEVTSASAADAVPRWIAVAAPALRTAIDPLAKLRAAEGFQVTILSTTDVLTKDELEHHDSRKLRERLREIAKGPGKSYVVLMGVIAAPPDADRASLEVPAIPGTVGRMKDQPTDNGYGCLDNNLLPTVAVGRMPARSAAEARQMVEKTLNFEREGRTAAWRRSISLLVGNPGGASAAERALSSWYVNTICPAAAEQVHPLWTLHALYHIPTSPWTVPDAALHEESLRLLQSGQAFTFYLGHSGPDGFWSNDARFLDRGDWAALKPAGSHSAGIFMTCGCWATQFDPLGRADHEGYGFAAMRNPAGPVAVIGASGESYAAAGQLAFNGLLRDLRGKKLPERLGEAWLDVKGGLAAGPMDFFTFKIFDYGDGSNGQVPLATQRLEHLEMWTLLGDPALRLPLVMPELTLEGPKSALPGATVTIHALLPPPFNESRIRMTLERPAGAVPQEFSPPPAMTTAARDATLLANFKKANDPVLLAQDLTAHDGACEATITLPKAIPWEKVVIRMTAGHDRESAIGTIALTIEKMATP